MQWWAKKRACPPGGAHVEGVGVTTDQVIIALLGAAFVAYVAKEHPSAVPALTLAAAVAAVIVAVMQTQ
jgi:hypothetical protein